MYTLYTLTDLVITSVYKEQCSCYYQWWYSGYNEYKFTYIELQDYCSSS